MQFAPQICLTLDIWTNRQIRSYLGMTARFIIDFKLKSVMSACPHFRGSHKGEDILLHFTEIVQAFDITGKVDNIVTDNGSNMLKAFHLLEISNNTDESIDTDDEFDDNDDLQPVEIDNNLSNELDQIQPKHYSCFAHTIQLIIKRGLNNTNQIRQILGKVSRLINHVRHSTVSNDIFDDQNRLQIANATRWNSQLTTLESIIQVFESPAMEKLDYNGKLNSYDINIVKNVIEILTPLNGSLT